MEEEKQQQVDIDTSFRNDLEYIKHDVLAKQPNGCYTKWSRALNSVTVINTTAAQYIDYWVKQYKDRPEMAELIEQACIEKLEDGLISTKQMIEMVKKSKDYKAEKMRAIEALGGEYDE